MSRRTALSVLALADAVQVRALAEVGGLEVERAVERHMPR
jgi:hypothetical protein